MATVTGMPAAAPYAASAPAALPADGAANARAPSARASETAIVMPRALNEPVGLRDSSFTNVPSTSMMGVKPSVSVTASWGRIGRTSA